MDKTDRTAEKNAGDKTWYSHIIGPFAETFGLSRPLAVATILLVVAVLGFAIFWFFHSAPPKVLTITTGPAGSTFETNAIRYRDFLATNYHVTLKILSSEGSEENLERLDDPKFQVDVGFVQGGVTNDNATSKLVSLGSINYEPLLVFYRGTNMGMLSEFSGKRLAIGPPGSGTHRLALNLLHLNGIETNGTTPLLDLDAGEAARALLEGKADAVFLMGDSASLTVMLELIRAPGIQLMDFAQAEAYTRKINYLNNLELPMGAIDFGKNIPGRNLHLIGPTVELIARPGLHPALSDLLLEASRQVNGSAGILRKKNEFPAGIEHDFPISVDAARFYKSGKSFLYRYLPFYLASLVSRVLVAFVPVILVIIPGVRLIPALYKWRIRLSFYRRYRALLSLERNLLADLPAGNPQELHTRLDQIEDAVNKMKVPASFADQFYQLRSSIQLVRNRLIATAPAK